MIVWRRAQETRPGRWAGRRLEADRKWPTEAKRAGAIRRARCIIELTAAFALALALAACARVDKAKRQETQLVAARHEPDSTHEPSAVNHGATGRPRASASCFHRHWRGPRWRRPGCRAGHDVTR